MAVGKTIEARISHKIDTEENWNKAVNFIPLKGELIIYNIDASHPEHRFKIGDGITTVINLPFRFNAINDTEIDEICGVTIEMANNTLL